MDINSLVAEMLLEDTFVVKGKKKDIKTNIPPEKRTFGNMPKYSGNKRGRIRFQDWLQIKKPPQYNDGISYGKAANGKWYGWSHRAVSGFNVGFKVKKDTCGSGGKEFTIKTEEQARLMAKAFAKDVS